MRRPYGAGTPALNFISVESSAFKPQSYLLDIWTRPQISKLSFDEQNDRSGKYFLQETMTAMESPQNLQIFIVGKRENNEAFNFTEAKPVRLYAGNTKQYRKIRDRAGNGQLFSNRYWKLQNLYCTKLSKESIQLRGGGERYGVAIIPALCPFHNDCTQPLLERIIIGFACGE